MIHKCAHCYGIFTPRRPGHRYCAPKCRAAAHREQSLPGTVTGVRQLKSGGWSVTVAFPDRPDGINIGARVAIDLSGPRTHAHDDANGATAIP